MLGLTWGCTPQEARLRFGQLAPKHGDAETLIYDLQSVARLLVAENAFCPTALMSGDAGADDEVVLSFHGEALVAGLVRFGFGFDTIGLRSETLSEQAMVAIARAELQHMIAEFAARYGPPAYLSDEPMRAGRLIFSGAAMFRSEDGGCVHLMLGHAGDALAGELRYMVPTEDTRGF